MTRNTIQTGCTSSAQMHGTFTKHPKLTVDFDQVLTAANMALPERAVPEDVTPNYQGTWGITRTYRQFSVLSRWVDTINRTSLT